MTEFVADGLSSVSVSQDGQTVVISFKNAAGAVAPVRLARDMGWGLMGAIQQVCESAEIVSGNEKLESRGNMKQVLSRAPGSVVVTEIFPVEPPSGAVVFDQGTPFELSYRLTPDQMRDLAARLAQMADHIQSKASQTKN